MSTISSNHIRRTPKKPEPKKPARIHPNIRRIFKDLFRITIAQKDIRSIEEQRMFGNTSTGDKKLDAMLATSTVNTYVTINDMIEYFRDGISFRLTDLKDARIIYEAVSEHTARWRDALQYAFNMGNAPVDDFILMERFIATIYEHAKFAYIEKPKSPIGMVAGNSSLYDFLYGNSSLGGTTFREDGKIRQSQTSDNTKEISKTHHNPNIDVFKRALISQKDLNNHARRS
jgi:hypothetical protein